MEEILVLHCFYTKRFYCNSSRDHSVRLPGLSYPALVLDYNMKDEVLTVPWTSDVGGSGSDQPFIILASGTGKELPGYPKLPEWKDWLDRNPGKKRDILDTHIPMYGQQFRTGSSSVHGPGNAAGPSSSSRAPHEDSSTTPSARTRTLKDFLQDPGTMTLEDFEKNSGWINSHTWWRHPGCNHDFVSVVIKNLVSNKKLPQEYQHVLDSLMSSSEIRTPFFNPAYPFGFLASVGSGLCNGAVQTVGKGVIKPLQHCVEA